MPAFRDFFVNPVATGVLAPTTVACTFPEDGNVSTNLRPFKGESTVREPYQGLDFYVRATVDFEDGQLACMPCHGERKFLFRSQSINKPEHADEKSRRDEKPSPRHEELRKCLLNVHMAD